MRWQGLRFTTRRALAVVALIGVLLGCVIVPLFKNIDRRNKRAEYRRVGDSLVRAIDGLNNRVPQGVSPSTWVRTVNWTTLCQFNVCYGTDRTSIDDLYRLREDLNPKLRGPVDVETLEWMWDRLSRRS